MRVEQGVFFKYAFFIEFDENDSSSIRNKSFNKVVQWCDENINEQWMVVDNSSSFSRSQTGITYYSKAVHKSPLADRNYPPAEIRMSAERIFIFDSEEDAAAFKIMWA